MKTVRELIEKYPSILNMRLSGLEFFREDSKESEILNLIEDFTDVEFQQIKELIGEFLGSDRKYPKISIERITDIPSVKIKVKNGFMFINDKYNNYKSESSEFKKVYLELLYYAGEYYDEWEDSCLSVGNFSKVKGLIDYLKESVK